MGIWQNQTLVIALLLVLLTWMVHGAVRLARKLRRGEGARA